MNGKKSFIIGILLILMLILSCDNMVVVLAIKNETPCAIIGTYLLDDSVSDGEIYNDKVYMGINLKPGELGWISMPNFKFHDKSDTSRLDIFVFCEDSLTKYRKLGIKKGIIGRSLIKKITIPSNSIKRTDTLTTGK